MSHDFHEIEPPKDHFPTVFDEVHGRDEFVTAYGAKALGRYAHFIGLEGNPDFCQLRCILSDPLQVFVRVHILLFPLSA